MRRIFSASLLVGAAALVGCASAPAPVPTGSHQVNVADESAAVTKNLQCEWLGLPDPMYPAKGNDFACVADTFASVILFVEPTKEEGKDGVPKVEKIKLVWKEWGSQVEMRDTKPDASRFLAYLAQRYFPAKDGPKLVDLFFSKSDGSFSTENLDVKYTYRKQPALNLHRLEIQNTDPDRRLLAYEAPHNLNPTSNGE